MRWWHYKSLRVVLFLALFMLAGETAVRVRAYLRFGSVDVAGEEMYVADPLIGKTLRPNFILRGGVTEVRINSLGFRGPEITLDKPPGVCRVLCLGDSVLFSGGVPNDSYLLTARLENHLRTLLGREVQVINAGVPGYSIESSAKLYEHRCRRLSPDVVVVCQVVNDLTGALGRAAAGPQGGKAGRPGLGLTVGLRLAEWRDKNFLIYHLVRKNLTTRLSPLGTGAKCLETLPLEVTDPYEAELTRLVGLARRDGCQVALCTAWKAFSPAQPRQQQHELATPFFLILPNVSLPALYEGFDRFNAAVRGVAQAQGALLVDLAELIPPDPQLFSDPTHLSAAGHALAGELLAEQLALSFWGVSPHDVQ